MLLEQGLQVVRNFQVVVLQIRVRVPRRQHHVDLVVQTADQVFLGFASQKFAPLFHDLLSKINIIRLLH